MISPHGPSAAQGIHTLTLQNFRSYTQLEISPEGHNIICYGGNGAGKTNLLEAISLLSPGRGLRRARLSDMRLQNSATSRWSIGAHLNSPYGRIDLSTTAQCDTMKERRTCSVFGKTEKTLSALARHISLVWLTPQMDRLFSEGMSSRRRFVDRLCVALYPSYNDLLTTYDTLAKERLMALSTAPDPHWLQALEQQLAEAGLRICHTRQEVCYRLNGQMAQRHSAFPQAMLHPGGDADGLLSMSPETALIFYVDKLSKSRSLDHTHQATTFGPHRFPIDIHHVDKNLAATYCSTGEQKALLLSIILAFTSLMKEYSEGVPVLLLDEVIAHLDEEKRAHLFQELWALQVQIWMTGTDRAPFLTCENHAVLYHVEHATLTKQHAMHQEFMRL